MLRVHAILLAFVAALIAVSMLVSARFASAFSAASPLVVRATMFPTDEVVPGKIVFSPKSVKRGTVVFKITNRAGKRYQCTLNVISKYVLPNHVVLMTVVFKRPGLYGASCADPTIPYGEGPGLAGQIRVT
jgi:hypothetical protein